MSSTVAAYPWGGETLSSWDGSDSSVVEITGGTSWGGPAFDPAWSKCGLYLPSYSNFITTPNLPSASSFWYSQNLTSNTSFNPTGPYTLIQFFAGGTEVLRAQASGFNPLTWTLYTLQSGSLTLVGSWVMATASVIQRMDINLVSGNPGSVDVFIAGVNRLHGGNLNHAAISGAYQVKHLGGGLGLLSNPFIVSKALAHNKSTIGMDLFHEGLNANSLVNTGYTGGVGNINELPTNDASFIDAPSGGLTSTFIDNSLNYTGKNVLAKIVGARARVQGAGPAGTKITLRSGGSNFPSTTTFPNAVGFQATVNSWMTDPNTSAGWTSAAAASAEEGVTSVT